MFPRYASGLSTLPFSSGRWGQRAAREGSGGQEGTPAPLCLPGWGLAWLGAPAAALGRGLKTPYLLGQMLSASRGSHAQGDSGVPERSSRECPRSTAGSPTHRRTSPSAAPRGQANSKHQQRGDAGFSGRPGRVTLKYEDFPADKEGRTRGGERGLRSQVRSRAKRRSPGTGPRCVPQAPRRTCAASTSSAPSEKGLDFCELPGLLLPHRQGSPSTLPRPPAVLREGPPPRHRGPKTQSSVFPADGTGQPANTHPLRGKARSCWPPATVGLLRQEHGPGSQDPGALPASPHSTHPASGARRPVSVSHSRAVQGLAQSLQNARLDSPGVLYGASAAPIPGLPTWRALPAAPGVLQAGPSGSPRGLAEVTVALEALPAPVR